MRLLRKRVRSRRKNLDTASERLLRQLVQSAILNPLMSSPRLNDPLRLLSYGYKVYSQSFEDGMIAEVFRRIGTASRRFIEFGVEDGLECNSAFLLVQGWNGTWIDGSADEAAAARAAFGGYSVDVLDAVITAANADGIIAGAARGEEIDLLSIDIDFNDYWVWQAIETTRPRLVVIEYNAIIPPFMRKTVAYNAERTWDGSNYFGASLGALEALGQKKGYSLVGCSLSGVNAFFVRNDLVKDRFCAPFTAVNHYEPPRFALAGPLGHPPGMGPWVDVEQRNT